MYLYRCRLVSDLHVRTQISSHGCSRLDTDFLVHAIGWMSVWRRLRSEPPIHQLRGQDGLDVIEDALGLAQDTETGGAHRDELAVGDGEDEGVVGGGAPPLPRPLPHQGGGVIRLAQRRPSCPLPPGAASCPLPPGGGGLGRGGEPRRLTRYRPTVSLSVSIQAGPPAGVGPGLGASGAVLLLIRSTINRHEFRRVPTSSDILPYFFRWPGGWPSA